MAGWRGGGVAAWRGDGCWGKYAVDGVVGAVGMVRMVGIVRMVGWWVGGVVRW